MKTKLTPKEASYIQNYLGCNFEDTEISKSEKKLFDRCEEKLNKIARGE